MKSRTRKRQQGSVPEIVTIESILGCQGFTGYISEDEILRDLARVVRVFKGGNISRTKNPYYCVKVKVARYCLLVNTWDVIREPIKQIGPKTVGFEPENYAEAQLAFLC